MPRFYLHICDGEGFTHDEEGLALANGSAARQRAIEGLRDLLAGEIQLGSLNIGAFIQIVDEDGTLIMTVPFREAVRLYEQPCSVRSL